MNLSILKNPVMRVTSVLSENSPKILLVTGIAGIPVTVFMAVKATPKALKLIEKEQHLRNLEDDSDEENELSKVDIVKTTWKCYVPSAIMGSLSIACIIASSSINAKRYAALGSLYSISKDALEEYQSKVKEELGERKEQSIRDKIAKDRIEQNPVSNNQVILTGAGDCLCYDALSGRYFRSNIEKIRQIQNDVNHSLISCMWVSLNEVYYSLGLEPIGLGEEVGWNVDNMVDFVFSSQLSEDNQPCLVLDYKVGPKHDYK